jgi:phenylalanyl-tRNA synthetase alpha subunit
MSEETTEEKVIEDGTNEVEVEEKKQRLAGSTFYKQKLEQTNSELQQANARLEELETQRLQEKENFKELWELEKQKREQAEQKSTQMTETYFNGLKKIAIKQEATKLGILPEAIEDLDNTDNSMVQIETTSTGNVNVIGAREFIESLKERKNHWFSKTGAPNINNQIGSDVTKPKDLSPKEILALAKSDPVRYKKEIEKKLSIVR